MDAKSKAHEALMVKVRTHLPESEPLELLQMWALKTYLVHRKPFSATALLSDEDTLAKLVAECIPTDTFQDIQANAHSANSPQAQLELGDILMYGLKGQERDASTAAYLYQKAATAGLPEAQTQMGMIMYQNISNAIAPGNPDAQSLTRPLPVERCQSDEKLVPYLKYLWVYLNDAAAQGYVSYFAVTQTRNANIVNSGGSYEVPEILQTAFDKIGDEANQIFLEKAAEVNPLACFSKDCAVIAESEGALKLCSKCRVAKYCSKACQVQSWKAGHKLECMAPL